MKTLKGILVLFGIVFLLLSFTFTCNRKENTVEVGQIWKSSYYENDPYREEVNYYNEIIDLPEDYVVYIQNGKDTLSETRYWFVVKSECVENCK